MFVCVGCDCVVGCDRLADGVHCTIFEYRVFMSFIVARNSSSDRSVDRYVAIFFKNTISLSDIGHFNLSRFVAARLSMSAFTFFSTTVLSVPATGNHFHVPTAFFQSLSSILSILLITDCDSSFCADVGGSNPASKLAQSLSVNQLSFKVSFHCLSSFFTLLKTAISLSVKSCLTCVLVVPVLFARGVSL